MVLDDLFNFQTQYVAESKDWRCRVMSKQTGLMVWEEFNRISADQATAQARQRLNDATDPRSPLFVFIHTILMERKKSAGVPQVDLAFAGNEMITLEDGTRIHIDADGTISKDIDENGETRNYFLQDGEWIDNGTIRTES